jgi:hypothetical protein
MYCGQGLRDVLVERHDPFGRGRAASDGDDPDGLDIAVARLG